MAALRAVLVGGIPLVLGRVFSAVRELWLAHQLGPTDRLTEYVVASTVFLALGGLLSGVASALMIRDSGRGKHVMPLVLAASTVIIAGFGVFGVLPSTRFESGLTVWCLVAMLPFFAAYGVANGKLIREGKVVVGMVAAGIQPAVALGVMVLPWTDLTTAAACGNLAGSILMTSIVFHSAYRVGPYPSFWIKKTTLMDGLAIVAVSAANIASPIIDRFFAASLGNSGLVLLNLSTIVFAAITGTLGIALGNAAVGRSFTSASTVRTREPVILGVLCSFCVLGMIIPAVSYINSRTEYAPGSGESMGLLLAIYSLAIPVALLNQVWIRVWNRKASVRDMLSLAGLLLSINLVGNFVFVMLFGVLGIAISTVLVQLAQCMYLGSKWHQTGRAAGLVATTVIIGLVMGRVINA
ncbi:hypothetical protein [Arthrobacter sp. ISL-72]|uniref:hypothetical protein n=1 Tax=Arthrobacter sp. ISL-72 TaxID=2819114 RepID=UPI001BE5F2FC|nr:hypothetical protein [Arthrobacter sp. ISL-72]MBT2596626.1 hypothetical protein [Arthrobacter sp. ISL-72]